MDSEAGLIPIPWDERAKEWLRDAIPQALDRAVIRGECLRGQAQLWAFPHGVGVSRVEGSELVLVAYQGHNYRQMMQSVIRYAEQLNKFKTIRSHAVRPGIGRWLAGFGFHYVPDESRPGNWVYRRVLNGE